MPDTGYRGSHLIPHGYNRYSYGCRCDTCRAAKAAYMRQRRSRAYVVDSAPEADPRVTHGTRFAYEERGCRCGECFAAARASSRWNRPRRGTAALAAAEAMPDAEPGYEWQRELADG